MNDQDLQTLEARLVSLDQVLQDFRYAIIKGERIDLIGLDKEIGDVCIAAVNARPESRRFAPVLQRMVMQLDLLQIELKRQAEGSA